ncbi:MAG: hypothetical protein ACTSQE_08075 [Candidatus Heimdallarchaeaceae archaeon]
MNDFSQSSPSEILKSQRLKGILTVIGESLTSYFKKKIAQQIGQTPNSISILGVSSEEQKTPKSKSHNVSYLLNTDLGKHNVNLLVKFATTEESYIKELSNHDFLAGATKNIPCIRIPEIVYKSVKNRCIIYEGISSLEFQNRITEDTKIKLAGRTLAGIHGINIKELDATPYKGIIIYLVSLLKKEELEEEIINLFLPSLAILQKSKGATVIYGDYHKANLQFIPTIEKSQATTDNNGCDGILVYVLNSEFLEANKDRCEDIGTYFAFSTLLEYQKTRTLSETTKNVRSFIQEYDKTIKKLGGQFELTELYPSGYTIDFHIATYILYDIVDSLQNEKIDLGSEKIKLKFELFRKVLEERPFS